MFFLHRFFCIKFKIEISQEYEAEKKPNEEEESSTWMFYNSSLLFWFSLSFSFQLLCVTAFELCKKKEEENELPSFHSFKEPTLKFYTQLSMMTIVIRAMDCYHDHIFAFYRCLFNMATSPLHYCSRHSSDDDDDHD